MFDHSTGDSVPRGPEADDARRGGGARVLSLVSQKGGVGKTTSVVNLGACFALNGHRTLLIGTDPQCGLSRSLGYGPQQLRGGLREVVLTGLSLADVAHPTAVDDLAFVSPDAWSMEEESQYRELMSRQPDALADAVREARELYDTILIDCPPGFGPATRAALLASDGFLVPVQAEELCRDSVSRLLSHVETFGAATGADPVCLGLFLTMADQRTRMSRRVTGLLDDEYGERLFACTVPRSVRLTESAVEGKPTVVSDRRCAGSRAYFDLMDEIIVRDSRARNASPADGGLALPAGSGAAQHETPERPAERRAPAASNGGADRTARLLADLERTAAALPGLPFPAVLDDETESEPDLVSLDDLLEEEERTAGDNGESGWGYGDDYYDTIN